MTFYTLFPTGTHKHTVLSGEYLLPHDAPILSQIPPQLAAVVPIERCGMESISICHV